MTTAVKICGITDETSLDAALTAGADYVGFVFFPKSPRHLDLARAKALRDRVPRDGSSKTVALVVDPSDAEIADIIRTVDPDVIQLHGHETVERVGRNPRALRKAHFEAIPVSSARDVEAALAYLDPERLADILLFDAKPDPKAVLPEATASPSIGISCRASPPARRFALAGGRRRTTSPKPSPARCGDRRCLFRR